MNLPPSGEQFHLTAGSHPATIVEVGGGIREYAMAGRDVLEPYPLDAICDGAHGTPLIPWPNRLEDGAYSFDGTDHQVALTEPAKNNAIHGLLRWRNWQADRARHRPHRRLHAEAAGNHVDRHREPSPAADRHPRDRRDGQGLQHTPAAGRATAGHPVHRPGARDDGRAWVHLTSGDGSQVDLWVDQTCGLIEVYTGDTLAPDRRRRRLGAEPMTCPPNALRTGDRPHRLEPGESLTNTWAVSLS